MFEREAFKKKVWHLLNVIVVVGGQFSYWVEICQYFEIPLENFI